MSAVWCADDTFLHELIFLSDSNLVVAAPEKEKSEEIKKALLGGTPVAKVLSSDSVEISLLSITSIQTDRNDDDIEIYYKSGKETKNETLRLASKEVRDDVYQALKSSFGDKFTETEDAYSVPRSAYGPLVWLTIFGLLTWGGAKFASALRAAEDYDIEGSRQGLKQLIAWVLEFLGPTGVYSIGGIICALISFSVFHSITRPEVMLVLQEEPYKKPSQLMLVPKYLALFAGWYVAARLFF